MYDLNIELIDGVFDCREEDSNTCDEICRICAHGMNVGMLRNSWREHLVQDGRGYEGILDMLSADEFLALLSYEYCDPSVPHSVFGYDPLYQEIARQLPSKYDTVIDFGCSNGLQSYWFANTYYIGVDDFFRVPCMLEEHDFFLMSAQDFINCYGHEYNPDSTLAICLHVPDIMARQAVADAFPNNIIVYNGPR